MTAETMFNKALLLLDRGQLDRGEAALREALELARREEDLYDQVQILSCLGEVLRNAGRRDEALDVFRSVLPLAAAEGLSEEERRANDAIASLGQ